MKKIIKKITRPFFDFSNPGHRIKKFIHVIYIVVIATNGLIGAFLGAILNIIVGLFVSYIVGMFVKVPLDILNIQDLILLLFGQNVGNTIIAMLPWLISLLICTLIIILLAIGGAILFGIFSTLIAVICNWFPAIMIYAFGELVENSQLKFSQPNTYVQKNRQTDNKCEILEPSAAESEITTHPQTSDTTFDAKTQKEEQINRVDNKTKTDDKSTSQSTDDYQPIIKSTTTVHLLKNDANLIDYLSTALKFSTDAAMISYLKELKYESVHQILTLPNDQIRTAVINLIEKENLIHKDWMCSCGAKNKPSARECSVCYKKREK